MNNQTPSAAEVKSPQMNKPEMTGTARVKAATGYSIKGLKAAWRHEEAFRMEAYLALFFIPLSFFVAETLPIQLILISSCFLVLITELINSAIEAIIDRISTAPHPLSGQAKDIGSSAVFLAMMLFIIIWSLCLFHRL